jgi:hypothetical protein
MLPLSKTLTLILELLRQCGIVTTVWYCYDSVVSLRQCGIVTTVWYRYDSVVLLRQCGIVTTVWYCYDSVVFLRQCGIVTTVWYCLFFILSHISYDTCNIHPSLDENM